MRTQLKAKLASIAAVNTIVSGIYTPPLPEGAKYPLLTMQRPLDGMPNQTLAGVGVLRREVWQIDAYASGAGSWVIVDTLCDAIRTDLDGAIGETWSGTTILSCFFDDGRDLPEEELVGQDGIVRRQMDFVIRYKTS